MYAARVGTCIQLCIHSDRLLNCPALHYLRSVIRAVSTPEHATLAAAASLSILAAERPGLLQFAFGIGSTAYTAMVEN